MTEKENKLKKSKQKKNETDTETEKEKVGAGSPLKEKKSKKRKAEKEATNEEGERECMRSETAEGSEQPSVKVDPEPAPVKKISKRKKAGIGEETSIEAPAVEENSSSLTTLTWHSTEKQGAEVKAEDEARQSDLQKHDKQLKNKLPTRQERQRRENQKKMQTFVAELRAQGKTKKEIDRLKKKVKAKLEHIQPNQEFVSVVALGDIQLSCRECSADFVFSLQEQHFYQERQFPPPVRCKECSAAKKVRMAGFDKKDAWAAQGGDGGHSHSSAGHQRGGGGGSGCSSYGSSSGGSGGGVGGGTRSNWGSI